MTSQRRRIRFQRSAQWRDDRSQIDLVINRANRRINLCEIKFHYTEHVDIASLTDSAPTPKELTSKQPKIIKTQVVQIVTQVKPYGQCRLAGKVFLTGHSVSSVLPS